MIINCCRQHLRCVQDEHHLSHRLPFVSFGRCFFRRQFDILPTLLDFMAAQCIGGEAKWTICVGNRNTFSTHKKSKVNNVWRRSLLLLLGFQIIIHCDGLRVSWTASRRGRPTLCVWNVRWATKSVYTRTTPIPTWQSEGQSVTRLLNLYGNTMPCFLFVRHDSL